MIEQTNLTRSNDLMADLKYNMSFTAGGLFFKEAQEVAEIYFDYKNWGEVRKQVLADNVLQAKTKASLKRFIQEIIFRLEQLNEDQLALLISGSIHEKKYLLWYAACKRHKFISEFAVEVIREKFLHLNYKVEQRDFDIFFNRKAEWHDELDGLTVTTVKKIRQVLFRIMREADIILPDDSINTIHISPKLKGTFSKPTAADFSIFPISDVEIKRLLS
jgi:hypothetical protein